ncbi:MAG: hypothetical protein R2932_35180 [Caldilineaceae bacterium]
MPAPNNRPSGCVFAPRCDYVQQRCWDERPALRAMANKTWVRCHFAEEIDPAAWTPANPEEAPVQNSANNGNGEVLLELDHLQSTIRCKAAV